MSTLATEVNRFNREVDLLAATIVDCDRLEIKYQKLIVETALLRLFYHMDAAMEGIALKLLSGTPYVDGTRPMLMVTPFSSATAASNHMLGRIRNGRATYLSWTTNANVVSNLRNLISPTDHILTHRSTHDAIYEDMRGIRNHIAHRTRSTGLHFSSVVANIYPARPRGITPARVLLSPRHALRGAPARQGRKVIEQYVGWSKVFFKTLARA